MAWLSWPAGRFSNSGALCTAADESLKTIGLGRHHHSGIKNLDVGITLEVLHIEGEDMSDGIEIHHGDEARIENLGPFHTGLRYDSFPLRINARNVGKQIEYPLNNFDFLQDLISFHTQPVFPGWARRDIPELSDVLRRRRAAPLGAAVSRLLLWLGEIKDGAAVRYVEKCWCRSGHALFVKAFVD